jgi:1,4-alpha-glucan branching enzyme
MSGYLALVLHAHLPFVRHPEHAQFLEENWLFEAITETYVPLLQVFEGWNRDGVPARLTLTLTPPLCAMLRDPLLLEKYRRFLDGLIDLAERETHRTLFEKEAAKVAEFYLNRLAGIRDFLNQCDWLLLPRFKALQDLGRIEIITCAATHAVLPLLMHQPGCVRAQLLMARDDYHDCFGQAPRGIWLPECAYTEGLEDFLHEAGLRWFITETHGILQANPKPRYAIFAPILTKAAVAAFGRDRDSAKQVWSRDEGYPGDPRYRDFYRDIGFDLEFEYVRPHLPASPRRGFTGLKYHRITGGSGPKELYDRAAAMDAARGHAEHFLQARLDQLDKVIPVIKRPPIIVCPYDAELFGHWWYEGPEFLDSFARRAAKHADAISLITPNEYLDRNPVVQISTPAASTWGEGGHLKVWLNDKNEWIQPLVRSAGEEMIALARKFQDPAPLEERALRQAGRELLLAQSSDWPFIIRMGTSPDYASNRVRDHLAHFNLFRDQLMAERIDEPRLREIEQRDNIFPNLDWRYWR